MSKPARFVACPIGGCPPLRTPRATAGSCYKKEAIMHKKIAFAATITIVVALCVALQAPGRPGGSKGEGAPAGSGPGGQNPVNVVLIIMDDVGVDQVGVYEAEYQDPSYPNHPTPCTPNLDALANQGIRFTNAWSNPVCSPTRSQIMTGMPACNSGIGVVTNPIKPDQIGLGENMYTMGDFVANDAAFGKWHLADESLGPGHPGNLGFSQFLGTQYNLHDPPQDGPSYLDWRQWSLGNCTTTEMIGWEKYATAVTTDDALGQLAKFKALPPGDTGWLLYAASNAAHAPFECPPPQQCPDPGQDCADNNWCAECKVNPTDIVKTRAMVQSMDHHIGRILEEVDFNNTAVIVIGDNGTPGAVTVEPFDDEHAKNSMYQGGINVPLIIRAPNQQPPHVCNALVSATDLFATVASFLNADYQPGPGVDSYSLRQYVDTGTYEAISRDYVYSDGFSPNFRPEPDGSLPTGFIAKKHRRAVRNEKYKLIEINTTGDPEYKMYRLYRPDLVPGVPLPHNPAILDDGPAPDEANSAFEKINLYQNPEYWYGEVIDAFNELKDVLDNDYRRLPTGLAAERTPNLVRTATMTYFAPPPPQRTVGYVCSQDEIKVGLQNIQHGLGHYRAFIEFGLLGLSFRIEEVDQIKSVFLDVAVESGGSLETTEIEVWPMSGDVSDYDYQSMTGCEDLYNSPDFTKPMYGISDQWLEGVDFCVPMVKTFELDNVKADLLAEIQGDKKFSLALKIPLEDAYPYDIVGLFEKDGGGDNDKYKLRIYYVPDSKSDPSADPEVIDLASASVPPIANGLGQSYPNPFNPTTTIVYSIEERTHVTLSIYDVEGKLVRTLVNEVQDASDRYEVVWDGRNDAGRAVSSGVYFYRLIAGEFSETRKAMLLK